MAKIIYSLGVLSLIVTIIIFIVVDTSSSILTNALLYTIALFTAAIATKPIFE